MRREGRRVSGGRSEGNEKEEVRGRGADLLVKISENKEVIYSLIMKMTDGKSGRAVEEVKFSAKNFVF